jgi:hypothetical protein
LWMHGSRVAKTLQRVNIVTHLGRGFCRYLRCWDPFASAHLRAVLFYRGTSPCSLPLPRQSSLSPCSASCSPPPRRVEPPTAARPAVSCRRTNSAATAQGDLSPVRRGPGCPDPPRSPLPPQARRPQLPPPPQPPLRPRRRQPPPLQRPPAPASTAACVATLSCRRVPPTPWSTSSSASPCGRPPMPVPCCRRASCPVAAKFS